MEVIFAIMAFVAGLLAFDVAALRWGADSRERQLDDYRR